MLRRFGGFLVRRRRLVAVAALGGFLVAGAIGGDVAEHLSTGGFDDEGAESYEAFEVLEEEFEAGDPNFLLLVTPKVEGGAQPPVNDDRVIEAGRALTERLAAEEHVDDVFSYWTAGGAAPLRSEDGSQALVLARITGTEDEIDARAEELGPVYQGADTELLEVEVGGFAQVFTEVGAQIESDLVRAELIAFPVTLILLVIVFRGVVAAVLPLGVGFVAIVGTFLVLRVLASLTQVSIFALNLTTAMGLGLAIDYSLFIVSRFREELAAGVDVPEAVRGTVDTAGRTVIFSALTVAVSLSALLVFPLAFLRSFAYGGIPVVLLAGFTAVVVLPAVLAMLGHRVDTWSIRRHRPKPVGEGAWHRIAVGVMRRPIPVATVVTLVLVLVGLPFLRIELGQPDDRVLPESAPSRQVHDQIRENFDTNEAFSLAVVLPRIGEPGARAGAVDGYAARLSGVENVARVDTYTGVYRDGRKLPVSFDAAEERFTAEDGAWLSVVPAVEPVSPEGEALVGDLRGVDAPFDEVLVGGLSAQLVDAKDALFGLLPLALGIVALTTFVVLFLMVGSLLVPVKALVLNLLSLTATFGAMVWIFQDGHLADVLNFTPTGAIEVTTPILMFCVAFGLSMDYEVFLLSRIKEEYDRTGDNERAVAVGLERTGRIVTAAAALIAIVFLAFATSEVTFIKLFGLGLATAVLVDASLVRATLVPAFMRLAGRANWWAPPPLRRVYERFGLSEGAAPGTAGARSTIEDPSPPKEEPLHA